MPFIMDNLQILATLGSALAVYIFIRMGARQDVQRLEARIDRIENHMDRIEETMASIDKRLHKLEGRFEERGYWESRYTNEGRKTGTSEN